MQKKRIVLLALAVIIVIVSLFAFFACNKTQDLDLDEDTYPEGLPSNYQGGELAIINAGLAENATADQIKNAVLTIYNVANRSRRTAGTSLMIQHTDAGEGMMIFKGFELKSGNAWYYQLPTQALYPILDVSYTTLAYTFDNETFYFKHLGPDSSPDCKNLTTFPYSTFILTEQPDEYDFDEFRANRYFLDDQLELCNMKMSLDLLLVDDEQEHTCSIEHDAENHVYKVKLVVDCSIEGTDEEKEAKKEALREWYLQAFSEGNAYNPLGTSVSSRTYYYWYADIEVWDNGYVKSLDYYEKWDSPNIMVNSEAVSNFNFYYNEEKIMAILKQDPKFTALSEEQQATFTSPDKFVDFYCTAEVSDAIVLLSWHILLIVLGCVIVVVVAIVVTIEVLVKKGKLPKLAAQREAAKQKRLAKKNAQNGESNVSDEENSSTLDAESDTNVSIEEEEHSKEEQTPEE